MPDNWDAHLITDFDPARVFCLIGTNAADYGAVSQAVGPKSDGLVQIDNAYVRGANRTFVHRSHSGRYGEVNSEEGYQNLRRFLFGTRKATVRLVNATLPAATSASVLDVWQAEVTVSIRGLPVLMDDQTAAHYCPVELGKVAGASLPGGAAAPDDDAVTPGTGPAVSSGGPPLTTVFLLDPARARQQQRENLQPGAFSPRCRYSLQIKVIHLQEQHGLFTWQNHLEGAPEWADTLIVDVGPDDDDGTERVWAAWEVDISKVTSVPDPIVRTPLASNPPGSLSFTIPLPSAGQQLLGARAAIALNVELLSP
jgi:hypothetical protein